MKDRTHELELRQKRLQTVTLSETATMHMVEPDQRSWAKRTRGKPSTIRGVSVKVERKGQDWTTGAQYAERRDRGGGNVHNCTEHRAAQNQLGVRGERDSKQR